MSHQTKVKKNKHSKRTWLPRNYIGKLPRKWIAAQEGLWKLVTGGGKGQLTGEQRGSPQECRRNSGKGRKPSERLGTTDSHLDSEELGGGGNGGWNLEGDKGEVPVEGGECVGRISPPLSCGLTQNRKVATTKGATGSRIQQKREQQFQG